MSDTAILELDRTWIYQDTIGHMGTHGRIIHPDILGHIEDCILGMHINEGFMADDIIVYLREIYGGPYGGPNKWLSLGTVENTLETEFNTSSALKTPEARLCAVDYVYDYMTNETEYWRSA